MIKKINQAASILGLVLCAVLADEVLDPTHPAPKKR